ncbi:MAG: ABC transporter ATP-binding protein [Kiloniellales bacterium]
MALLSIKDLQVAYGEVTALHDVSLEVDEGELVAILGANGAGKTTLLRCISGLLRPRSGEIRLKGESIANLPVHEIVRRGLTHVPEGRGLMAELTVMENLRLGMYLKGPRRLQSELARVLELFPVLRERAGQPAGMLSGGEQQMLAIARSLVAQPSLLMVDELSLGLAPKITSDLMKLLSRIHEEGVTVVMVEQNAHQALKYATRVYVLANGRTALSGTARELADDPKMLNAYLGKD